MCRYNYVFVNNMENKFNEQGLKQEGTNYGAVNIISAFKTLCNIALSFKVLFL